MQTSRKRIRMTFDEVAELVGLPTSEEVFDRMLQFDSGAYSYAYDQAKAEDKTEEEAEQSAIAAEQEEQDEHYRKHRGAMVAVFERLCENHDLVVEEKGRYNDLFITPKTTWTDALKEMIQTINGVGPFRFDSVREFLDSGPYRTFEGVSEHLHWLKRFPDVYGPGWSVSSLYESALR
jgi:hypothetical protein